MFLVDRDLLTMAIGFLICSVCPQLGTGSELLLVFLLLKLCGYNVNALLCIYFCVNMGPWVHMDGDMQWKSEAHILSSCHCVILQFFYTGIGDQYLK